VNLATKIGLAILDPFTSRKLWMTVIGLIVINSLFWTSVWYLYSFTEQWKAQLFYQMFASTAWATTGIVFSYLGISALLSGWTNSTVSTATSALNTLIEHKDSKAESVVKIIHEDRVFNLDKAAPKDIDDDETI
jgi:hypothetical protein